MDVDELVLALMWDGEYAQAHSFADDLTKWFTEASGPYSDRMFGWYLGIRTTLAAVIAKNERASTARRAWRAAACSSAKRKPVSAGAKQ